MFCKSCLCLIRAVRHASAQPHVLLAKKQEYTLNVLPLFRGTHVHTQTHTHRSGDLESPVDLKSVSFAIRDPIYPWLNIQHCIYTKRVWKRMWESRDLPDDEICTDLCQTHLQPWDPDSGCMRSWSPDTAEPAQPGASVPALFVWPCHFLRTHTPKLDFQIFILLILENVNMSELTC